jgi:hypothetical protein
MSQGCTVNLAMGCERPNIAIVKSLTPSAELCARMAVTFGRSGPTQGRPVRGRWQCGCGVVVYD